MMINECRLQNGRKKKGERKMETGERETGLQYIKKQFNNRAIWQFSNLKDKKAPNS